MHAMELSRNSEQQLDRRHDASAVLGARLTFFGAAVRRAPDGAYKVGIAIIVGWTALLWIAISFVRGQFHYIVLMWVAVYPYCYYFFSYPAERSIFTVDRAFIVLLVIEMLSFRGRPSRRR